MNRKRARRVLVAIAEDLATMVVLAALFALMLAAMVVFQPGP